MNNNTPKLSPLQRIVTVTYQWINRNGIPEFQQEEWTLAQCIRDNVPTAIVNALKEDIQADPENPPGPIYDCSEAAERGDTPRTYKLQSEYNSELYCKRTVTNYKMEL